VSKCFPLSMLADILCECILPYYFHEAYPSDFFFGGRLVFLLLIGLPIIHLLSLRNWICIAMPHWTGKSVTQA
jgi:hypothetical protein